jgi:hypothetical protein
MMTKGSWKEAHYMPSDYKAITEHNEEQLGKDTSSRKTQVSMYSDPTHFVYEILQNADDYDATEVLFKLSKNEIVIEHNGVPFKKENVKAITYFGKSTSREVLVKTGRFGIGFKSVFAFTATPIIISGFEHFQIYRLYRVREYPYPDGFPRSRTRIILPFNHESEQPDFVEALMSQEEAYRQISECLPKLNMNTLLFTQNIKEIHWEVGNQSGCYSREDREDDNPRLTTIKDETHENTYLVFSKIPIWENEKHKPVEIAFAVDAQSQLAPIHDEFLHVLFPTTQKTDLRFILNGPYRTNPARETISLTDPFNIHLLMVTCRLIKELLPKLRDRKLLTLHFLSILPNEEDTLSSFYAPLRDIVVNEFRNTKLTPTKRGDHAAASRLYRVNTELSDLISDEDLALLLGNDRSLPLKVDEILQRRDERGRFVQYPNTQFIDKFLTTLRIPDWNTEQLISVLLARPEMIKKWLKKKSVEDHQVFYALLYDFLGLSWTGTYWYSSNKSLKNKLSDLPVIRCSDGAYRTGDQCFLPSVEVKHNDRFPRVVESIYSSGEDNDQKAKARGFLEAIGVRPVDETVEIEAILNQRYIKESIGCLNDEQHLGDMKRFIDFVERKPDSTDLFAGYYIFKTLDGYMKASEVFLDVPYLDTGLAVCYDIEDADFCCPSSLTYEDFCIDLEILGRFAKAVGAKTKLEPILDENMHHFENHPEWAYLGQEGGNWTKHGIDQDYIILEFRMLFDILFDNPSIAKSKLVWQTMWALPKCKLKARFRWNARDWTRTANSSLVHDLMKTKWVPQISRGSTSFVSPCEASVEYLPIDFPYDPRQEWLKVIKFGEIANKHKEENDQQNRNAKELGFDSVDEADTMAEIASVLKERGKSPNELHDKLVAGKRRKERILIELEDAPEKEYEQRPRSVRITTGTIDRRTHLRARYTTDDNRMECQMCRQDMPFKKRYSNEDYFEAVEALKKDHFPKEHEAQHLALCPECAAKYKEFVKRDAIVRGTLYNLLKNSDVPEVRLPLDDLVIRIWFEDKHWQDLKTVLDYYENIYDPDDAD